MIEVFQIDTGPLLKDTDSASYYAAVSGGADSTAMLAMLCQTVEIKQHLTCIHIEHGIRPPEESLADAAFVEGLCKRLGIPCITKHIEQGLIAEYARQHNLGIEAAARKFRYDAFVEIITKGTAEPADPVGAGRALPLQRAPQKIYLFTAHTKDDLLETITMRFLRGSGPAGLAGIQEKRQLTDNIILYRPLLYISRSDIIEYLHEKHIEYISDKSNNDTAFLRNRIRLSLMPLLDKAFPGWREAAFGLGQTQDYTASFIADEARARVQWTVGADNHPPPNKGQNKNHSPRNYMFTPAKQFFTQPEIIREEAIFQAADMLLPDNANDIRRKQVRRFCLGEGRGACRCVEVGAVRLERSRGEVRVL
ncbi:MAG: tRNA lysidine(34) synthetase TilS [Spirochaetaceae bacterium]|jgi:tRNA(Ile)-lysidine synthase|nr:tRNA lysidine(34) synthetase TilS [Spirochaetaceae bacterium]